MNSKDFYNKKNNIFQSKIWADFQKEVGREVLEIDGSYYFKEKLFKDKSFLFCPKGPLEGKSEGDLKLNDQSIVFVRTEPSTEQKELKAVTKNSILSQQHSPKQTLVLDLIKSEDELLKNMKSKHRYNIRLAEKKEAKVRQGTSKKDIDNFYNLSLEVSKRDKTFAPHPREYYEKMVKILGDKGNLQIFTAEYKGKPLSSVIILFYGKTAVYLHGASSSEHRELMPNHLVQWEAIKEAKKRGCKHYDFWGVAVNKLISDDNEEIWDIDEKHTWAGVTRFKLGFVKQGVTGEIVEFPGAFDLPINKFWYNSLTMGNKVKKLLKR